MEESKKETISQILNTVTLIIAVIGILIAVSANRKSEEANQIAEEANRIARESNRLTVRGLNSDIYITSGNWAPTIYTCVNPLTENYLVFNRMVLDILITNSGGTTTSLVKAEGLYPENIGWDTVIFEGFDMASQLDLPIDIPGGSSRQFYVTAFNLISHGASFDDMTYPEGVPYGDSAIFLWKVEFGNGQIFEFENSFSGYSPPYTPDDEECVYYNKFLP
ncbi:MAG: hypothetical protein KBE23_03135 [Chloroflexi bacterium]|nr:hypothetical protein [Chloroflexota bacterium]MBP7041707.1 hypothetical protein [Chloroflexota bacterium]